MRPDVAAMPSIVGMNDAQFTAFKEEHFPTTPPTAAPEGVAPMDPEVERDMAFSAAVRTGDAAGVRTMLDEAAARSQESGSNLEHASFLGRAATAGIDTRSILQSASVESERPADETATMQLEAAVAAEPHTVEMRAPAPVIVDELDRHTEDDTQILAELGLDVDLDPANVYHGGLPGNPLDNFNTEPDHEPLAADVFRAGVQKAWSGARTAIGFVGSALGGAARETMRAMRDLGSLSPGKIGEAFDALVEGVSQLDGVRNLDAQLGQFADSVRSGVQSSDARLGELFEGMRHDVAGIDPQQALDAGRTMLAGVGVQLGGDVIRDYITEVRPEVAAWAWEQRERLITASAAWMTRVLGSQALQGAQQPPQAPA